MRGGSSFIVRFGDRLIGITAAHVVQVYRNDREQNPALVCQLRLMPFALHDAVIDCDLNLDIATFALSEDELRQIEGTAVDCTGEWPPPPPTRKILRETYADRSALFSAYGGLSGDRDILLTFDPAREQSMVKGLPLPPLGLNMSGCSGGPVLINGERNGLLRWFPAGIIIGGSNRDSKEERGEAEAFDTIRVRRIHFVREDGTIERPSSGWLP
jgi:hypothetical protein